MIKSALNWARPTRPGFVLPGVLVPVLCALAAFAPASASALNHGFTGSFGSATSTPANPEPLSGPAGVAVNEIGATKGDVYVVDRGNNRVEQFSSTGAYIGQFNGTEIDGVPAGAGKEAPAKFSEPEGIAIDNDDASPSKGDVYVVDKSQGAIDKFSATGEYLFQLTGFESEVIGVAVDPSGDVWVAEENGSVQEFGDGADNILLKSVTPEFARSPGIAVDSEDNLYLLRHIPNVAKFSKEGGEPIEGEVTTCGCVTALAIGPSTNDLYANDLFVDQGTSIAQYGPFGEPYQEPVQKEFGKGHLASGSGIAINGETGIVYVADSGRNDVDMFGTGSGPLAPITEPASEETASSATMNGTLTSGSEKISYSFTYNLGESCTGTGSNTTSPGEAESDSSESTSISGLQPSAEYTFCMTAENEFGSTQGGPKSFETKGVPPTAETGGVSELTNAGATLHGEVDPFNQETEYSFEYSTEQSLGHATMVQGSPNIAAHLLGEQSVSVATGHVLAPETTYYYRVVAQNGTPPPFTGTIQSFTTAPPLPTVTTEGASQITTASATIAGTVEPGSAGPYSDTTWSFEYGTDTSYSGGSVPVTPGDAGIGTSMVAVSAGIEGLASNTPYHYRLLASNANDDPGVSPQTVHGADRTFTTAPLQPFPGQSSHVSETAATLSGDVDPDGHALQYRFEYGTSTAYGQSTPVSPAEETDDYTTVSAPLTGLTPGIPYHYRLVAIGAGGEAYSSDATFTLYSSTPEQTGNPFPQGQSTPASFATFPLLGTPMFPPPPTEVVTPPKPLTKAEKLAKALMSCRKDKPKTKRVACVRHARKEFSPSKKAKK